MPASVASITKGIGLDGITLYMLTNAVIFLVMVTEGLSKIFGFKNNITILIATAVIGVIGADTFHFVIDVTKYMPIALLISIMVVIKKRELM